MLPGGGTLRDLGRHIATVFFGIIGIALCLITIPGAAGTIDPNDEYWLNLGIAIFCGLVGPILIVMCCDHVLSRRFAHLSPYKIVETLWLLEAAIILIVGVGTHLL